MKNFLRKIWDAIVAFFEKIPHDKKLHAAAGFVIATFFGLALGMKFCFWPLVFIAGIKEFFDEWTTGQEFDWKDYVATLIGAIIPQIFVLLNMWWF